MEIQHYQQWISKWYKERGWYSLSPFIRMNFLTEETGEVAQAVRTIEMGRDRPDEEELSPEIQLQNLTEELGDVLDNLFILADKYDIQLEDILTTHKQKMIARYQLSE